MKPIIFNPQYVKDIVNESKPALLTISKTNLVFNNKATKLLAFKKGDEFALHLDGNTLSIKLSINDGFKVSNINGKGCDCISAPGILIALKRHVKVATNNLKFEIGEFKTGSWPLLPSDGETAFVK